MCELWVSVYVDCRPAVWCGSRSGEGGCVCFVGLKWRRLPFMESVAWRLHADDNIGRGVGAANPTMHNGVYRLPRRNPIRDLHPSLCPLG